MMFELRRDDLTSEQTRALVELHMREMHRFSPACHVFALDESGLRSPDVTLFSAWDGAAIAAMGALRDVGDGTGEVKSMRTHPDFLRRGAAAQILDAIIEEARTRGYRRVSLETGSGAAFDAALELYRKRGFRSGPPFGSYTQSDFNQFFHLDLR